MTNESRPDERAGGPRHPSAEEARLRLCALGEYLRGVLLDSNVAGRDGADVVGVTSADTIYAIDKVADDALVEWFEQHWPDVELVSEGLEEPVLIGADAAWTVIVDSIDGTRGLMYDKRSAWSLAAAAPRGGRLRDVVAAAMTELPTSKQRLVDQFSGKRGRGGVLGARLDLATGARSAIAARPSSATDLEHGFGGFAKFFAPGKTELASLEIQLFERIGAHHVFDDQYLSSGGQVHELMTGHDRFVADLRPLVVADALACHPYDICCAMLLELAGGVVTDPWGEPLDAPLDTTTPIAWVGYANARLAGTIGPVLTEILRTFVDR
jgi:fructose-1,6-bisphosphatase/inositol monophosphatase family enzyme